MAETQTADTQHDIDQRLEALPFRTPVIEEYDPQSTDHKWAILSEAMRQDLMTDKGVRETLVAFASTPVSESLPGEAAHAVGEVDPRVGKLTRFMGSLVNALALPPVPDKLISPDIRYSEPLMTPHRARLRLRPNVSPTEAELDLAELEDFIQRNPGISADERKLIERRYKYARDVKMLALGAELIDNPLPPDTEATDGLIAHELPSGTRLVITAETHADAPDLLDPTKWESRIQLKDRVYSVTVGGTEYIMKERKTARHIDTTEHGHIDGLTSEQEFETARYFNSISPVGTDGIRLQWEKPLGYVAFPDGYQFCVFQKDADMGSLNAPIDELAQQIFEHPEAYGEDYRQVVVEGRSILETRPELVDGGAEAVGSIPNITYDEYSRMKAEALSDEARELLRRTLATHGYENYDENGYRYHISREASGKPILELICFDFEYYSADPGQATQSRLIYLQNLDEGNTPSLRAYTKQGGMTAATAWAMRERAGYALPPKK